MRISFLMCPKQTINCKYNHAAQKLQVQTNVQKSLTVPGSDTHTVVRHIASYNLGAFRQNA